MKDMKIFVALTIFIALLFNGCGKEEEKNKAEVELAKLPYATLNEKTVTSVFQFIILGVPQGFSNIDVSTMTMPPWPMESEPEADNCPVITDNSSGTYIYIENEGDCTDKWGFKWTGKAIFEGTHDVESGKFNLDTTYENFGFSSKGVQFAETGVEHTEGRYSSESPFSFEVKHTINIILDITKDSENSQINLEGFEGMSGDATDFSIEGWIIYNWQYPEGAFYVTRKGNVKIFDSETPDTRYDDVSTVNMNVELGGEGEVIPITFDYFISGKVMVEFKDAVLNIRCGGEFPDSGSMIITAGSDRAEIIFDDDCNGCFDWTLNDEPQGQICK